MRFINPVRFSETRRRRGWWRRGLVVTALAASALVAPPLLPPAQAGIPFCDDVPPVVGFASTAYTVAEDQGTLDIQVGHSDCIGQIPGEAVANWAVSGGTATAADYGDEAAGTLTWPDGDYTSRVISLTLVNDTRPESSETVVMTMTPGNDLTVVDPSQTTVTISANDNTSPRITHVRPRNGSVVRDRTPLIAATVTDNETNLSARAIRLVVDGRFRTFTYDRATDRLQWISGVLTRGSHTVRVRAEDPQGAGTVRSWAFRVGR